MTTKPRRYDFYAHEGDLFHEEIQFLQGGLPVDLTGITLRLEIKRFYKDAAPAAFLETGAGIDHGDPLEGTVTFDADSIDIDIDAWLAEQKEGLPPIIGFLYSLKATLPGGRTETWLKGLYNFEVGVQR